jgi:hypothetical protein
MAHVPLIHEPLPLELEVENALQESFVGDDPDSAWWRILADLHPKQRAFVEDAAPRKCAEKGRRAGGSWAMAAWLLQEWHRWPGKMSLFIALTKEHAKNILWPTLELMNDRYQLGMAFNGLDLSVTLPNGYRILLRGAKDKAQVEKLRGFAQGARRIGLDECGSYGGHLDSQFRYMVQSVLSPQLMDMFHLGGGQMAFSGSPGIDPMGFFFERCTGRDHRGKPVAKWSTHHWTAFDNPYLDAAAYLIEELDVGNHILDDTPAADIVAEMVALKDLPLSDQAWAPVLCRLSAEFRREYLADWVKDADALCYTPSERNFLEEGYELPKDAPWRIVIAADVGWGDGNGFCVAAKSLRSRDIIVLRAYYLPEMDDAEIAAELRCLRDDWHTSEIYVDCGGEGLRLVANMENHGVIVQAADKPRKKPRIEYVRALLKTGSLKLRPEHCADVIAEWSALPWSEDRQSHREGFVDDVSDALLMAVNPLSQRFQPKAPPRAKPGERGYAELLEAREKAAAVRAGRRIVKRKRKFALAA